MPIPNRSPQMDGQEENEGTGGLGQGCTSNAGPRRIFLSTVEEMSQVEARIPATPQPLTARETEVALLLAEGLGSAEIATRLSIAPSSAKWYLRQVFLKLGVHTRADATHRARQLALSVRPNAAVAPRTEKKPGLTVYM